MSTPIPPTPTPPPPPGFHLVPMANGAPPLRLPFDPSLVQIRDLHLTLPDTTLMIDTAMYFMNILWPYFVLPIGFMLGFYLLTWIVQTFRQAVGMAPTTDLPGRLGRKTIFPRGSWANSKVGYTLWLMREAWRETEDEADQ